MPNPKSENSKEKISRYRCKMTRLTCKISFDFAWSIVDGSFFLLVLDKWIRAALHQNLTNSQHAPRRADMEGSVPFLVRDVDQDVRLWRTESKKRKRKKEKEKKERIFNQPKFQDHSVRSFQFYPTLVMLNRSNNSIAPKRHQVKVVLSIGEK